MHHPGYYGPEPYGMGPFGPSYMPPCRYNSSGTCPSYEEDDGPCRPQVYNENPYPTGGRRLGVSHRCAEAENITLSHIPGGCYNGGRCEDRGRPDEQIAGQLAQLQQLEEMQQQIQQLALQIGQQAQLGHAPGGATSRTPFRASSHVPSQSSAMGSGRGGRPMSMHGGGSAYGDGMSRMDYNMMGCHEFGGGRRDAWAPRGGGQRSRRDDRHSHSDGGW
ncbi:MAG: hypothetical protein Q9168_005004 [Polycauliona sp. 1 TL-2023]